MAPRARFRPRGAVWNSRRRTIAIDGERSCDASKRRDRFATDAILSGRRGGRSRSRERDRRLVRAEAVPVVGGAAQKHGRACCVSASTLERRGARARDRRRDGRVLPTRGAAAPWRPQSARRRSARHPTTRARAGRAMAPRPVGHQLRVTPRPARRRTHRATGDPAQRAPPTPAERSSSDYITRPKLLCWGCGKPACRNRWRAGGNQSQSGRTAQPGCSRLPDLAPAHGRTHDIRHEARPGTSARSARINAVDDVV